MVVRKPYAFLIKNFRIIHFVIFGILFYLFFKSYKIYSFINGVSVGLINRRGSLNYISYMLILVTIVLVILFIFIYYLMRHKNKPKFIYLISIIGYILFIILLLFTFNYFNVINGELVDQKIIRMYRDFYRFMLIFEVIISLFMLIRALGFDIKKFDFKKDLCELNLSSEDAEEVEISLSVDTNFISRFIHRFIRKMGYYFRENILVISIIFVIALIVCFYHFANSLLKNTKYFDVGEYFNTSKFTVKVNNAFVTSYNSSNDNLENYYLIVSLNIKGITDKKNSIDSSSLKLKLKGDTYYPIINKCGLFSDLGVCYKYKTISNKISNNYILIFDIDDKYIDKKASFVFEYGYNGENVLSSVVKFTPINLDNDNMKDFKIGDAMSLDLFGLNDETLFINSYEFGNEFTYKDDNIIKSDKLILKLEVESSYDIKKILENFVYIGYDSSLLDFNILLIDENYVFLELDKDISLSNSIWFDFRNRGYKYKYYLVNNV